MIKLKIAEVFFLDQQNNVIKKFNENQSSGNFSVHAVKNSKMENGLKKALIIYAIFHKDNVWIYRIIES